MTPTATIITRFSAVVLLGFAAASCGSDTKTSSTTAAPATTAAPTTAAPTTVVATTAAPTTTVAASDTTGAPDTTGTDAAAGDAVQLVDSSLGSILADEDGTTLYMFAKDTGTTSACTDACAAKWPAVHGPVTPGDGLDAEDFATITGTDGEPQATFYGHPLYYFSGDTNPGDTNGQGVGGVWFALDSEGNPAGAETTDSSTATSVGTEATVTASSAGGDDIAAASSVQLADSSLGKILTDGDGLTLYMFSKDTATARACTDACANAWPALHGPSTPGDGLDDEDFATITGTDGQPQTTFYGHPLYHFAGDAQPGDVTGQGVGGVWFALDSEGNAVGS